MEDNTWVYALFFEDTPGKQCEWTWEGKTHRWTVPDDGIVYFYVGETGQKDVRDRTRLHYLHSRKMITGNPDENRKQLLYHFIANYIKSTNFTVVVLQEKSDETQHNEEWYKEQLLELGCPLMNSQDGNKTRSAKKYASKNQMWRALNDAAMKVVYVAPDDRLAAQSAERLQQLKDRK